MFESLLHNHEARTSCALLNLYLALLAWVSVPLAYLLKLWFTGWAGNRSSFQFKIDSLKYYSNLASVTKPQRFVPVIRNNSLGRTACHSPSRTAVSPLCRPCSQQQLPSTITHKLPLQRQFLLCKSWSELCLISALGVGTRILAC